MIRAADQPPALFFQPRIELHRSIEVRRPARNGLALGCPNAPPPKCLYAPIRLLSGPTAEEARRWHLGPTGGARIEAKAAAGRDIIVHSLIVRAASHIVRSTLVCQNGFCRLACRRGVAKLGTQCPDGSGLRTTQTQTVRACQNVPAWTGSLWTVWSPASPRFALCDPAACSDFAGRAARKGARGSKIGSGSESGLSTRPCRLAGFLRFPHRFTPSGASGASGPSGPLAAQSPRPFYCGLLPTIRPSHTQPRQ